MSFLSKFLFQLKEEITMTAEKKTSYLTWIGLGFMSMQFGVLARLTWWEYSWDIMEPVTYFVTYGTAMAAYAYYCLTKQVKFPMFSEHARTAKWQHKLDQMLPNMIPTTASYYKLLLYYTINLLCIFRFILNHLQFIYIFNIFSLFSDYEFYSNSFFSLFFITFLFHIFYFASDDE